MVILGLTVEGGVDTSQKEIRISTVLPGGAAHQHGFLKVMISIVDSLLPYITISMATGRI